MISLPHQAQVHPNNAINQNKKSLNILSVWSLLESLPSSIDALLIDALLSSSDTKKSESF